MELVKTLWCLAMDDSRVSTPTAARRKSKSEFGDVTYWEKRYDEEIQQGYCHEWLKQYLAKFEQLIHDTVGDSDRSSLYVLHPGCGNSNLPDDLWKAGYRNIVSVDNCENVIQYMEARSRRKRRDGLVWKVMDAIELSDFASGTFDLVIDKTFLDTLTCSGSGHVRRYLAAVLRVLKPGGVFLCLTFGRPEETLEHFEDVSGVSDPVQFDRRCHCFIVEKPCVIGEVSALLE